MTSTATRDLDQIIRFSAEIGADPLIVQAAGGNTSVKSGGVLWVKASGTWLSEAASRAIMVPVDLAAYRQAVLAGDPSAANASQFVVRADAPGTLRPSVETAMHAVLPHKFIVHVHCVDTLAWAVQRDPAALGDRLDGFNWCLVPYITPGLPLAEHIARQCPPETDVFILGSHGLVVGAETLDALAARLAAVRERLRREVDARLRAPRPDELARLETALRSTPFRPARHAFAHAPAMVDDARRIAAGGTLYPDHAVFMGPGTHVFAEDDPALQRLAETHPDARAVIVADCGVGVREDALKGADEMALCLANVVGRLRIGEDFGYLPAAEIAALLDWDAEKYRQSLNAGAGAEPDAARGETDAG